MIIWIASYPRSGNTFVRTLLYHQYGIETCSAHSDVLEQREGVSAVVGQKLQTIREAAESEEAVFLKTHGLPPDASPAIYVVRDGRDALVSHARYRLSFGRGRAGSLRAWLYKAAYNLQGYERTLERLITGTHEYGGWGANCLAWTNERKDGVTAVVRYEDLLEDPIGPLQEALRTIGWDIKRPVRGKAPPFEEMHEEFPQFFRKGGSGNWRTEMPPRLQEMFWETYHETMTRFGYGRR